MREVSGEEALYKAFDITNRAFQVYSRANIVVVESSKTVAATGNYTAEDVIASASATGTGLSWTFSDVGRVDGATGAIVQAQCFCQTTAQAQRVTLYLFTATPTSMLDDNSANTAPLYADIANYVGRIDFPAFDDLGGFSSTIATPSTTGNLPLYFDCADAANDLYGILVTRDAFTNETANDVYKIRLYCEQY